MSVSKWTDRYGGHHCRSSNIRLVWVELEPMTKEFRSNAIPNWAVKNNFNSLSEPTLYSYCNLILCAVFIFFYAIAIESATFILIQYITVWDCMYCSRYEICSTIPKDHINNLGDIHRNKQENYRFILVYCDCKVIHTNIVPL